MRSPSTATAAGMSAIVPAVKSLRAMPVGGAKPRSSDRLGGSGAAAADWAPAALHSTAVRSTHRVRIALVLPLDRRHAAVTVTERELHEAPAGGEVARPD